MSDDKQDEGGSDNNQALPSDPGGAMWNSAPEECQEDPHSSVFDAISFSTESTDKAETSPRQPTSYGNLTLVTTSELMEELHKRFEHIILIAKKSIVIPEKEKRELKSKQTAMFIGDAHVLLGMTIELEDHLKQVLSERRSYLYEMPECLDDNLDEDA